VFSNLCKKTAIALDFFWDLTYSMNNRKAAPIYTLFWGRIQSLNSDIIRRFGVSTDPDYVEGIRGSEGVQLMTVIILMLDEF
jgi:hypothetical protein